jgi:hypothetical protein
LLLGDLVYKILEFLAIWKRIRKTLGWCDTLLAFLDKIA